MRGFLFTQFTPSPQQLFSQLLSIFFELLLRTGGNVQEALEWLAYLDEEYGLTSESYSLDQFIGDLIKEGYIQGNDDGNRQTLYIPSAKTHRAIREHVLEEIFGKIQMHPSPGQHQTPYSGKGNEYSGEHRPYQFGDPFESIAITESLWNAEIRHGIDYLQLTQEDLVINDAYHETSIANVLMIDVSHSMILYGEDRITPAKKVAIAFAELLYRKYPGDTLNVVAFGNDAWEVPLSEIPYLQVGPYHTNTVAGLELAMQILLKKPHRNKHIVMITDGKPTCIKEGIRYYKNSFGADPKIINATLRKAIECRKKNIQVTTIMIASDPYLKKFVEDFTKLNRGRALYTSPDNLESFLLEDYLRNRFRKI